MCSDTVRDMLRTNKNLQNNQCAKERDMPRKNKNLRKSPCAEARGIPRMNQNLLKNPCAKAGLDHWEVVCSGGDGFLCEEEPVGCTKICEGTKVKENLPCWATSYDHCEKVQLVSLPMWGISGDRLDEEKPPIRIQDWYSARFDSGCKYKISTRLLADDRSTELDAWDFFNVKQEGSYWSEVKHTFTNYPPGVRYVEFKHGGQDTNFWAGNYGAKMTNSGVFVGKEMSNRKKKLVRAKIGKNLLKNPCAASDLKSWEIVSNFGNGWCCEAEPVRCKPIKEANGEAKGNSCWATSFQRCEKKQVIDLWSEGFEPDAIDAIQPEIRFSEWYGSHDNAGCLYWLKVRLLNSDMKTISEKHVKETKRAEGEWYKAEERFNGYGPGVRFIEYLHGGCATCRWVGHYGVKITCSFVGVFAESESSF